MIVFNVTHNAWAYVHATHACTLVCVAAAAADLHAGQTGVTSLMAASRFGHVEAVRVLIEKGALIDAVNEVRIHSQPHMRAHKPSYTHTGTHLPANTQSSLV
jgi:hypothetical protein